MTAIQNQGVSSLITCSSEHSWESVSSTASDSRKKKKTNETDTYWTVELLMEGKKHWFQVSIDVTEKLQVL